MSTRRAFFNILLGRYTVLVLRAASMIVLARLLAPEQFGVFAIAASIVALLGVLSEFGLSSYLIQHPNPQHDALRAVAGLSLALAIAQLAAIAAAALTLPSWIWSSDLKALVLVLATGLLAQALATPIGAMLQRELRFGQLAWVEVGRATVHVSTAIGLAAAGLGAMALAIATLFAGVVGTLLLLLLGGRQWFAIPSIKGWSSIIPFGGPFTAASGTASATDALVVLILGKMLGYGAVGLFNRSQVVVSLVNTTVVDAIGPVILPLLSREMRARGNLTRAYMAKIAYLSALHWPFYAFLALYAEPVVNLLLGNAWREVIPAVQALAVMGAFLPFTQVSMKFFVALGAMDQYLRLQIAVQIARLAAVSAGAFVSLEAACLGLALSHGIKMLLVIPSLKARIRYRTIDLIAVLGRAAVVMVLALVGPVIIATMLAPSLASHTALAAGACLAGVGWLIGIVITRHPLGAELSGVLMRVRQVASTARGGGF